MTFTPRPNLTCVKLSSETYLGYQSPDPSSATMPSIQQNLTKDDINTHIEILDSTELARSGRESLEIINRFSTSKGQ